MGIWRAAINFPRAQGEGSLVKTVFPFQVLLFAVLRDVPLIPVWIPESPGGFFPAFARLGGYSD